MLKQTLVAGIMGLGFMMSAPTMAHSNNHYHDHQWIQPVQHCVPGHKINNRQANQRHRIQRGVQKGQLVKWEKRQLKQQQKRIKNAERRMRSDGCLTRDERRRLMHRLDRASNKIRKLRHNNVRRHYNHYNNHHNNNHHRNHR